LSANAPQAPSAALNAFLLDTNILLGLALSNHHQTQAARAAVAALEAQGTRLCVAPQNLVEFYATVTRPRDANGPGWKPKGALAALEGFEKRFELLPDAAPILAQWRALVAARKVIAKASHDTRLAAFCLVYGVGILTANPKDFRRFVPDGLRIVEPASFTAPTPARPNPK
jgi:predicted nucleic acid-binding protein